MTTQVPDQLIAGDTWEWTRELSDYPASEWTAAWYCEKADHNFSVAAVADGDTFTGTVSAAISAVIRAGQYRWRLVVTRTADAVRKTAESGWLDVLPDPAAAGNVDHRGFARRMLEAAEAALDRRATNDQLDLLSYSLGSRSSARDIGKLLELRDKLKAELRSEQAAERIAAGLGNPRRLYVRFDR